MLKRREACRAQVQGPRKDFALDRAFRALGLGCSRVEHARFVKHKDHTHNRCRP